PVGDKVELPLPQPALSDRRESNGCPSWLRFYRSVNLSVYPPPTKSTPENIDLADSSPALIFRFSRSRLIQRNRRIYYSVNPSSTKLKANGQWLIAGLLTAVCLIVKEPTSKLPYWLKSNQSSTFCVANQLRIRTMAQRAKAGVSNHVRS